MIEEHNITLQAHVLYTPRSCKNVPITAVRKARNPTNIWPHQLIIFSLVRASDHLSPYMPFSQTSQPQKRHSMN